MICILSGHSEGRFSIAQVTSHDVRIQPSKG